MARSTRTGKGRKSVEATERFEALYTVDAETGCHIWKRKPDAQNRVRFFDGEHNVDPRAYVWKEATGEYPAQTMRNTCRAKRSGYICVNQNHIVPRGIDSDGMVGRQQLSPDDVLDIRKRYHDGESCVSIAKDYPVSEAAVYKAAKGITYSWVI